ncbi:hypothetical protein KKA39_01400, partial [Patescibacteria group bacterium]|nr:hypothetical protein [Patescibacteria group bacterium]MBU1727948.1 hypothetical protein [Patescibacteria group bacterium]
FKEKMEKLTAVPEEAEKVRVIAGEMLSELISKRNQARKEIRGKIFVLVIIILFTIFAEIMLFSNRFTSLKDFKLSGVLDMISILLAGVAFSVKKIIELIQKRIEAQKADYAKKIEELKFKTAGIEPKNIK